MGLKTSNIVQTLAILQAAIFHKLVKTTFIMESQSRGTELTRLQDSLSQNGRS